MARFIQNRSKTQGKVPGSVIFVGNQKMANTETEVFRYNKNYFEEIKPNDISDIQSLVNEGSFTWINIDGLHDTYLIENLGEQFEISSLLLEDVVNTDQRPSYIEESNYIAIILKSFYYLPDDNKVYAEQISFILFKNCLITLQERKGDFFDVVRDRIRKNKGRIRSSGSDYLCYGLIDALIDSYFTQIEILGSKIEALDKKILTNFQQEIIEEIYLLKTEINYIRNSVRPLKEILSHFSLSESPLIHSKTRSYLKDIDGLSTHINEVIESYSMMISDQLNIYNTKLSNRANDVMKVLTIFASIFIPLTLITGIYGTNFDNLPELHYKYSYFIMWAVMIGLAATMLIIFKKRRWF